MKIIVYRNAKDIDIEFENGWVAKKISVIMYSKMEQLKILIYLQYEINGETMYLDKDILVKENKIYSPETCVFVPQNINKLFTKRQNDRGKYPIGVSFDKKLNEFRSYCSYGNGNIEYLNLFNTPEEAFQVYKEFKENYIKQIADEYKDKIPKKLYEAMYAWKVDIDD